MERLRNLFMEGKITQCSEEYSNHPIFIVNQAINQPTIKRRCKLKTDRQKNAERLIRLGVKWEKERQKLNEIERQRELEVKAEQAASLHMVVDRNMDSSRLRNSDADSELGLKELEDDFIEKTPGQRGKINMNERQQNSMIKSLDYVDVNDKNNNDPFSQVDGDEGDKAMRKVDTNELQYEDIIVSELKQTKSVRDMYKLANEIDEISRQNYTNSKTSN